MLVVKTELWPLGDENRAREIGRTYIFNTGGTASVNRGDYEVRVARRSKEFLYDPLKVHRGEGFSRTGSVRNFSRKSYNVWRLVTRALKSAFPEEA